VAIRENVRWPNARGEKLRSGIFFESSATVERLLVTEERADADCKSHSERGTWKNGLGAGAGGTQKICGFIASGP